MIRRALVAAAVVLGLARSAGADDGADQQAFAAAAARLAAGDAAGARAGFEALAARAPSGVWADDALAEAAALAEVGGDRAAARALWARLVADHPHSRLARRAQARLDALAATGGDDGAFDRVAAEVERLLAAAAAADDPTAALTALGGVLDDHPGYPPWSRTALALGEAWSRIGSRARAATWLAQARARATSPAEAFRAELALARLAADRGDLDGARGRLRALVPPDPVAAAARDEALADLARRQTRRTLGAVARGVLLALAALAAVILWRRRRAGGRRLLWPPPVEVIYQAPVALGLIVVAEAGNPLAAAAVLRLSLGALVITWVTAAVARALGRPPLGIRLAVLAAVGLAVVAWVWRVLDDDALLELLIETWRRGHG